MAQTNIPVNDPKAIKKQSAFLAVDVGKTSYFTRKFAGKGIEAQTPIQILPHLESEAGDQISYDLVMQLRMKPVRGEMERLRNKEEPLRTYTDQLYIDMLRGGVDGGGRMTRKRTIHDLRKIAHARQVEWWARVLDEAMFIYLSGARGVNPEFIEDTDFTGYAGNSLSAPDAAHIIYGGDATSKATLAAEDTMKVGLIDRWKAKAGTMGGGITGIPQIQPCEIDGEPHYVMLMHPWQAYNLRQDTGSTGWLEIQKAAAGAEGSKSPIFKGSLGMHNGVVLHEHRNVIRFSDYGAGSNVAAARALFLGRQAGVIAYGNGGEGRRFWWHEEMEDRDNIVVMTTGTIVGIKKTTFTIDGVTRDFGVGATDTACADPG